MVIEPLPGLPVSFAFLRVLCGKKPCLYSNRDRFAWVNSSHPHRNPPPSIGGGRVRKWDYFRVRDDNHARCDWIPGHGFHPARNDGAFTPIPPHSHTPLPLLLRFPGSPIPRFLPQEPLTSRYPNRRSPPPCLRRLPPRNPWPPRRRPCRRAESRWFEGGCIGPGGSSPREPGTPD